MNKIWNYIYLIVLFLNLSETFRLLSYFLKLDSFPISVGTLLINFIYIAVNFRYLRRVFFQKIFFYWVWIIFFIPILFLVAGFLLGSVSTTDFFYWFSFISLFSTLFIVSVMMSYYVKKKYLINIFYISVLTTILGFILNSINFNMFVEIGRLSGSTMAYVVFGSDVDRYFSFFLHPNAAALSSICFFVFLLATPPNKVKGISTYVVYILVLTAMILVTGSRTSLLLVMFIIFYYLPGIIYASLHNRYRFNKNASVLLTVIIAFIALFVFIGAAVLYLTYSTVEGAALQQRLAIFFNLFNGSSRGSGAEDDSLVARLQIIGQYWNYIKENPFFGYGPQFARAKLESGEFSNPSQNVYIESALNYGIFYTLFYIWTLYQSYKLSGKGSFKGYVFNPLKVFIILLFFIGFSINNLFLIRAVVISLGVLIGMSLKPAEVDTNSPAAV